MRKWKLFGLTICGLFVIASTQSLDEEEPLEMGGHVEGSANLSDDEDLEGSSLPPDTFYATTPRVRPKFSSPDSVRKTTTVVRQKISTFPTTTPSGTTRIISVAPIRPAPPPSSPAFSLFGIQGIIIVLAIILVLLAILVLLIICCRTYSNRNQAYRPGQRQSPDALLKE